MPELHALHTRANATLTEIAGQSVPESFGNDQQAFRAVSDPGQDGAVLCDRSHWGYLQLSGADRLRYLHNQSTNDFYRLQAGQGCETVFTTPTGRTIDLATALVTEESVLLVVSPQRREKLMSWLDRYIFPADKVDLQDLSAETAILTVIGASSRASLAALGVTTPVEPYSHALVEIAGIPVRVVADSGLASPGYTLILGQDRAGIVWEALIQAGLMPAGERVWQWLRIQQGRPEADAELTEDDNPLEVRLWQTISFEKGCYIGQETIARLNTYKGVKQELWGLKLSGYVPPAALITYEAEKAGRLTSITETPDGWLGLGYIRTKVGGVGLTVQVGDSVTGEVLPLPYLPRSNSSLSSEPENSL